MTAHTWQRTRQQQRHSCRFHLWGMGTRSQRCQSDYPGGDSRPRFHTLFPQERSPEQLYDSPNLPHRLRGPQRVNQGTSRGSQSRAVDHWISALITSVSVAYLQYVSFISQPERTRILSCKMTVNRESSGGADRLGLV